ncbi:MAG: glycosyltransferase family 39 protein [Candidatus Korobacteraceae bacterium]
MRNYAQRAMASAAAHGSAGSRGDQVASGRHSQWLLLAVVVISTLLLAARLHVGFNLADDPAQTQIAEKVLHGARPHVDFQYAYTGGLEYLHAFALHIFGDRVLSLRLMLLVFFVGWVPAFWYIAYKLSSTATASLLTLLAVTWSVPVCPSPLGSWYGLYFATFGTAALFRYIETRRSRWVFLAGILGGLSFLAKMSGLYFLVAALLFLIFDEQNVQDEVQVRESYVPDVSYSVLLTLVLVGFDIMLLLLLRSKANVTEAYHFAFPGIALSFLLIAREWGVPRFPVPVRLWQMTGRVLPLLLGAMLPVAFFLKPYVYTGTVGALIADVIVKPIVAWQPSFHSAINPVGALCCIPLLAILAINAQVRSETLRIWAFTAISVLGALALDHSLRSPSFARWVWVSAATAIPLTIIIGVVLLLGGFSRGKQTSQLMLLMAVAGLCSLVQFPFSVPFYFCFVVPLGILAFMAVANIVSGNGRLLLLLPVAVFYLAFVTLQVLPTQIYSQGLSFQPVGQQTITAPSHISGQSSKP